MNTEYWIIPYELTIVNVYVYIYICVCVCVCACVDPASNMQVQANLPIFRFQKTLIPVSRSEFLITTICL